MRAVMFSFEYLKPCNFDLYAELLFKMLSENMSQIIQDDFNEDGYDIWYSSVNEGIKNEKRRIILITENSTKVVVGFFQYYTNKDTFMMEEIQIKTGYRTKFKIFRKLYGFVLDNIVPRPLFVEAYTDINNSNSMEILNTLGLELVGKTADGKFNHFKGYFDNLMRWYVNA